MRICEYIALQIYVKLLTRLSYVINSEAAKALYKTMPGRTTNQPKDLSREWHSDGECLPLVNWATAN
jgi:hypothetical protein